MMAEKPIIFTGESVRAILAGQKSQTRRVMKLEPHGNGYGMLCRGGRYIEVGAYGPTWIPFGGSPRELCPRDVWIQYARYHPGDSLWVRETWATRSDLGRHVEYRASHQEPDERPFDHIYDQHTRWKSSMFMPRWASRITLEVTDVRFQRLQDISDKDAIAEGAMTTKYWTPDMVEPGRAAYRKIWDSINRKKHPWDSNPWVWAYTFRRIR